MQSADVLVATTDQIKVGLHRAEKTDMQSPYVPDLSTEGIVL